MNKHLRRRILANAIAVALLAMGASTVALAQAYPSKPIRLVCPFPPGGAVDIASRAIAAELSKTLGQPVNVENKPGAGGNVGLADAARAPADGYTLFLPWENFNTAVRKVQIQVSYQPKNGAPHYGDPTLVSLQTDQPLPSVSQRRRTSARSRFLCACTGSISMLST